MRRQKRDEDDNKAKIQTKRGNGVLHPAKNRVEDCRNEKRCPGILKEKVIEIIMEKMMQQGSNVIPIHGQITLLTECCY